MFKVDIVEECFFLNLRNKVHKTGNKTIENKDIFKKLRVNYS